VRIAYNSTGQRVGERHQRAKHSEAIVLAVRNLYDEHAVYPVEIARQLGVKYCTVRSWIYRWRRNVPVDHYEEKPDAGRTTP